MLASLALLAAMLAPAPRLLSAEYAARLTDAGLEGDLAYRVRNPSPGRPLELGEVSFAVRGSDSAWRAGPAGLALQLAGAGDRVVRASWSQRGEPCAGGERFGWAAPPAAVSTLALDLPADRGLVAGPGALVTGPEPAGPGRVRYLVRLGAAKLELTATQPAPPGAPAPVASVRRDLRYELRPGGATLAAGFDVAAWRGTPAELALELDPRFGAVRLVAPEDARLNRRGQTLTIRPAGGELGRVRLELDCDLPDAPEGWPLPGVQVANAVLAADDVAVEFGPELRFDGFAGLGRYSVRDARPAGARGYRLSLARDGLAPAGGEGGGWPRVRVRTAGAGWSVSADIAVEVGAGATATLRAAISVERGPLDSASVELPAGWVLASARLSPDDPGAALARTARAGGTLTVTPPRPWRGGQRFGLELELKRLPVGPGGPRALGPVALPQFRFPQAGEFAGSYQVRAAPGWRLSGDAPPARQAFRVATPSGFAAAEPAGGPGSAGGELDAAPEAGDLRLDWRLRVRSPATEFVFAHDPGPARFEWAGDPAALEGPALGLVGGAGAPAVGRGPLWRVTAPEHPHEWEAHWTALVPGDQLLADAAIPLPMPRAPSLELPAPSLRPGAAWPAGLAGELTAAGLALRTRPTGPAALRGVARRIEIDPARGAAVRLELLAPAGAAFGVRLPANATLETLRIDGLDAAAPPAGGRVAVAVPSLRPGAADPARVELAYSAPLPGGSLVARVGLAPESFEGAELAGDWESDETVLAPGWAAWPTLRGGAQSGTPPRWAFRESLGVWLAALGAAGAGLAALGRRRAAGPLALVLGLALVLAPGPWAARLAPAWLGALAGLLAWRSRAATPAAPAATPAAPPAPPPGSLLSSTLTVMRPAALCVVMLLAPSAPAWLVPPPIPRLPGPPRVESAEYRLTLPERGGAATGEAEWAVSAPGPAALELPAISARLRSVTLDGAAVVPGVGTSGRPEVVLPRAGSFRLRAAFALPAEPGARGLVLDVPPVARTGVVVAAPAGCRDVEVASRRGAQWVDAAGRTRADHGAGTRVEVRWRGGPEAPPAVAVAELAAFDAAPGGATLQWAALVRVEAGEVRELVAEVPAGLIPGAPEVVAVGDGPAPSLAGYEVTTAEGGGSRVTARLAAPARGALALRLALAAAESGPALALAAPRLVVPAGPAERFVSLRADGLRLEKLDRAGFDDGSADELARRFGGVMPAAPPPAPALVLRAPPAGRARPGETPGVLLAAPAREAVPACEVTWTVGATAEVEAVARLVAAGGEERGWFECDWPGELILADVRAENLLGHELSGGRVRLWLRQPAREVRARLAGRLGRALPAALTSLELPVPLSRAERLRVGLRSGAGWSAARVPDLPIDLAAGRVTVTRTPAAPRPSAPPPGAPAATAPAVPPVPPAREVPPPVAAAPADGGESAPGEWPLLAAFLAASAAWGRRANRLTRAGHSALAGVLAGVGALKLGAGPLPLAAALAALALLALARAGGGPRFYTRSPPPPELPSAPAGLTRP